jgi:hypothetical protein
MTDLGQAHPWQRAAPSAVPLRRARPRRERERGREGEWETNNPTPTDSLAYKSLYGLTCNQLVG